MGKHRIPHEVAQYPTWRSKVSLHWISPVYPKEEYLASHMKYNIVYHTE